MRVSIIAASICILLCVVAISCLFRYQPMDEDRVFDRWNQRICHVFYIKGDIRNKVVCTEKEMNDYIWATGLEPRKTIADAPENDVPTLPEILWECIKFTFFIVSIPLLIIKPGSARKVYANLATKLHTSGLYAVTANFVAMPWAIFSYLYFVCFLGIFRGIKNKISGNKKVPPL